VSVVVVVVAAASAQALLLVLVLAVILLAPVLWQLAVAEQFLGHLDILLLVILAVPEE
jgi:hypothetical protein